MAAKRRNFPIALTVAGSDSGGGAGIQADLKTFLALKVHGTSAITCVTAQNPKGVMSVQAVQPGIVDDQLRAIFAEIPPTAVKTGMLYAPEIIQVVAQRLRQQRAPLVVDPVMVATSRASLIQREALGYLRKELLPLATLVTPNLDEAGVLFGGRVLRNVQQMRDAARGIYDEYGCAVLLKGGHLRGYDEATDIFFDGSTELLLSAPFVRGVSTHGTGCTYSAAITSFLARGKPLNESANLAKQYITCAVAGSYRIGRHQALEHLDCDCD